ncbi:hypothetical protein FV218_06025 [Methylobacterium sp. WL69]|uniref:hypothetical protein n=1 Tax=Methylobacterium sp. WL69 TaxID=2603893 RepID=UPI0011CA1582|nr:hypothetical protein [Methylobacterium sp. WL69]TXM77153.1 hypothetical protein FV218_06025 [Methylobacterium sp. WL69]
MNSLKNLSGLFFASACTLAVLTGASEARTVQHTDTHSVLTNNLSAPVGSPYWLGRMDTDSGNAKNPALPSYAQARGQETGGPARELIPN